MSEAKWGGHRKVPLRKHVLGLEIKAIVPGVHAVYFSPSLRRKPLKHIAEWAGDFSDAGWGTRKSCCSLYDAMSYEMGKTVVFLANIVSILQPFIYPEHSTIK